MSFLQFQVFFNLVVLIWICIVITMWARSIMFVWKSLRSNADNSIALRIYNVLRQTVFANLNDLVYHFSTQFQVMVAGIS